MGQNQRATKEAQPKAGNKNPQPSPNQYESSKLETAGVATEADCIAWLKRMIIDTKVNLQSKNDDIDSMDARNNGYLERIEELYNEDDKGDLNEDEL